MNEIEKKQQEIRDLQAPPQLEERLRNALKKQKRKNRLPSILIGAAAALILITFTYNYSAFAFYGKKIFGYESLMSSSLQALNEEGYIHEVNKSITFHDGTKIFIEGILSDTNRFHVYYKIEPNAWDQLQVVGVTGFFTDSRTNMGVYDTEVHVGLATFDAVSPFAKELHLQLRYDNQDYTITFPYDAEKAIPTTLKKSIGKTIEHDFGTLKLKKIIATNASTVITASLDFHAERNINPDLMGIQLLADGQEVSILQSGSSSTLFGSYDVELLYDAIPVDTENLELVFDMFNGYSKVNQQVPIEKGTYPIGDKWIEIQKVEQGEKETRVTIASDFQVLFDDVSVLTEAGETPLQTTGGFNDQTDKWIRTLYFATDGKLKSLKVGGMYYMKTYGEKVKIDLK